MNFSIIQVNPDLTQLTLEGEFDAAAALDIKDKLTEIVDNHPANIDFDITNVSFIDSSGLGAMVFLYKRIVGQGYSFVVSGVQGQPLELFKMLRIDQAIPVREARDISTNEPLATA